MQKFKLLKNTNEIESVDSLGFPIWQERNKNIIDINILETDVDKIALRVIFDDDPSATGDIETITLQIKQNNKEHIFQFNYADAQYLYWAGIALQRIGKYYEKFFKRPIQETNN